MAREAHQRSAYVHPRESTPQAAGVPPRAGADAAEYAVYAYHVVGLYASPDDGEFLHAFTHSSPVTFISRVYAVHSRPTCAGTDEARWWPQ